MGNKRFSQFSDRTLGPDEPRPSPGYGSGPPPVFPPESTAAWPTAPGPKGPRRNTVGFPEVKVSAKQDMADDKWIQGAIKHKGALTRKAKSAGMSPQAFAQEHKGDTGTTGKQARLAITLKKIGRGK